MSKTGGGLTIVGKDQEETFSIEEILIKHLHSMYSTALRLTKNKEKAEDLVQDACLRAIKYSEQLRSSDKVKAWLFKILINAFINKYRKIMKEPPLVEIELSESLLESASALYRHNPNPEEILIKSSLDEEIKEALDNLHVDLRVVLWLSDVEGFTYQEIGEMLECPMGTIASRLYRARSLLREALWKYAKKKGGNLIMVMECSEARKIIYLTSGEELLTGELVEAKRHIEHCAKCSEFFREEETLKNLIRERAPREKAPPSLRENILAEIGKRHGQRPSNRFYDIFPSSKIARIIPPLLIGVFLILAVSSIFYFVSSNQEPQSLVSLLAEDHITNIPEAAQILSSEPVNIEDWFRGKIDFVVKVPELPGAKLLGGRLCRINNNRIALLFYEKDRKPISLFVMDDSLADLSSIGKAEINGKKLRYQSEKGCNLIFWQEKGIVYALVSDIQREELMRLVPENAITD